MNETEDTAQLLNQQNTNQPQQPPVAMQTPPPYSPPVAEAFGNVVSQNPNQQQSYAAPLPTTSAEQSRGMFSRRMNRLGFFLGFIYLMVPFLIFFVLVFVFTPLIGRGDFGEQSIVTTLLNIITFLFGAAFVVLLIPVILSLYIRRLHDLNHSGWWILLTLIPVVDFLFGLYLLFAPGKKESNQWGEPVESLDFLTVLGFKNPT